MILPTKFGRHLHDKPNIQDANVLRRRGVAVTLTKCQIIRGENIHGT